MNKINYLEGYFADVDGNIWSDRKYGFLRKMKPHIDRYGYQTISVIRNGKRSTVTVHRLVASAYLSNPDSKPQVNHKNGVKTDNRVENLEWCTNDENEAHKAKMGLSTHGERNCKAKITYNIAKEIREVYATGIYTLKDISMFLPLRQAQIWQVARGNFWNREINS